MTPMVRAEAVKITRCFSHENFSIFLRAFFLNRVGSLNISPNTYCFWQQVMPDRELGMVKRSISKSHYPLPTTYYLLPARPTGELVIFDN